MPLMSNKEEQTPQKENTNNETVLEQGDSYNESKMGEVLDKIPDSLKSKKAILIICGVVILLAVAGIVVQIVSSGGSTSKDTFSKYEDNTEQQVEQTFKYSSEQRQALRAYGFSGEEIDEHEKSQDDPDALIDKVTEDIKTEKRKVYKELQKEMLDSASPEYKALIEDTWLAGEAHEVKMPEGGIFDTIEKTENIRYKKLESHGNQCFIKITLEDGATTFMTVHPDKYITLKDEGNMVITYKKVVYGDTYYVLDIKEKPITSVTEGSNSKNVIQ